jgi:hypothetical protein
MINAQPFQSAIQFGLKSGLIRMRAAPTGISVPNRTTEYFRQYRKLMGQKWRNYHRDYMRGWRAARRAA